MDGHYYILALSVSVSLAVGLLVVLAGSRNRQGQIYVLLTLCFITLSIANTLSFDERVDQLLFMRIVMASASISAFLIYQLVRAVRLFEPFSGKVSFWIAVITGLIVLLDLTPAVFSGFIQASPPRPIPGPGALVFFLHFVGLVALSVNTLYRGMNKARGIERKRLRSLTIGLAPIMIIAPVTGFILPTLFGYPGLVILSPLYTLLFVIFVGYAIARHGLFDIKLAAVRTVAYILSISALAGLYYSIAYFVSTILFRDQVASRFNVSSINILLALALAFVFQPVKHFFDQMTDRIFYRDGYVTSEFLIRVGRILISSTDLKVILRTVGKEISLTLKANGGLFIVYKDSGGHETVGEGIDKHFSDEEINDLKNITGDSVYIVGPLENETDPELNKLQKMLASKGIALILPLKGVDTIIGYLMLGEHKSGVYGKQDIDALEALANELVIAVQNARSVQTVKELNSHLEQRIHAATSELRASNEKLKKLDAAKDEFVSMASHQLRTPLTSVKGYISMVLEGDAGKITPMQRQLLSEAFVSSERMVHLISDFLNVSRLQTGKFVLDRSLVNLSDLVEEEVKGLKATAKLRSLNIVYRKPTVLPSLYIDAGKIHQVIMNFIDNAIYYSSEDTTIKVKLYMEDGFVVLEVHDTGIGVPKNEQAQLFTKFFRASNAKQQRPDGTGIGLYLAKKVVDAHKGAMIFKSSEGKGSVFGFRLPIKVLSENP